MKVLIAFLFTFLILINLADAQNKNTSRLNDEWKFLKSDIGGIWEAVRPVKKGRPESVPIWETVTLPHCFNESDAVDPDINYYQGPGWYNNQIEINNPYSNGRTLLHFEGAGQKTTVYVYMTEVSSHTGGYNEWTADITDAVKKFKQNKGLFEKYKGKIPISIRCDNSRDLEMIPSDLSDFNIYGGIYRYLNLVYKPSFSIERLLIDASVDAKGEKGNLDLKVRIKNFSPLMEANLKVEIIDPEGNEVFSTNVVAASSLGEQIILSESIDNPLVWAPSDPQLYTCKVTLSSDAGLQTITEKFGFRNFEFIENGPFILNGSRLLLRGTHRHEDHAGVAAAMTEEMIRTEMSMMKEMGVNFIRLGHYQQSRIVLDLCDSLGMLVWEEIPWCRGGLGGEKYKEQARDMLSDMIDQHRNHPSVIIWGLGNENDWPGDFTEFDEEKIRVFMNELNTLSHQLDPSRKTAIRRCKFCSDIVDVYSPSIWAGWYRGQFTEYYNVSKKEADKVKHFLHVEWGASQHARRHSENSDIGLDEIKMGLGADERDGDASLYGGSARVSKDGEWTETYGCNLIDWHLMEQEKMDWLTGTAYWPFKDFSTPVRPENPIPYVNQKGVVERDFTKKEAFYVFQSWWSEKPMAHIYGHSWPTRWGNKNEEKLVKVYSNCDEAELFVNGESYGIKKRNGQDYPAAGLRWSVVFREGENNIKVIAIKNSITIIDEIKQVYQTEKWGKPAKMVLKKISQKGNIATIEVSMHDAKNTLCLNARNVVVFGLTGDGKLIDNMGTSSGARKVELYNGKASIKVKLNTGRSIASVESKGLPTAFCDL